jgi:hypothetical protein
MTDFDIVASFKRKFNTIKLLADSMEWAQTEKPVMMNRLIEVTELLETRGELTREQRTDLTSERNDLQYRVIHDDPARIDNAQFDAWLKETGQYLDDYSPNDNRHINKNRLNRLLAECGDLFVVRSKGYKNCMFVMSSLDSYIHDVTNLHPSFTEGLRKKCANLIKRGEECGEEYDLPRELVVALNQSTETMADRQEIDSVDHRQIVKTLNKYTPLIENIRTKYIAMNEINKAA